MQLHQRGLDLLLNVQDAADHIDAVTKEDMRRLLAEIGVVLGQLLERDIPDSESRDGQIETQGWDRRDH